MAAKGQVFRPYKARVYVADPVQAKEVLANNPPRYHDHSDFFYTRQGIFGPRPAQIAIGRGMRTLLQNGFDARQADLPGDIERYLAPVSRWPDAANHLLYRQFADLLLGPGTPERLRALIEQVVHRSVIADARKRYLAPGRIAFRRQVMRDLTAEVAARRQAGGDREDVLGVTIRDAPSAADASQLAEVFLSCLFALTGAVGFLTAWAVYLLGTAGDAAQAAPGCVVREALRMWPVAWFFARRPEVPHELGPVAVTPADRVVVCSYLVHRNPACWEAPDEFRPQRWAASQPNHSYIPFGWGPHSCAGAGLALAIAERLIAGLTEGYHLNVVAHGSRPHISAALAPPEFSLHLVPRRR